MVHKIDKAKHTRIEFYVVIKCVGFVIRIANKESILPGSPVWESSCQLALFTIFCSQLCKSAIYLCAQNIHNDFTCLSRNLFGELLFKSFWNFYCYFLIWFDKFEPIIILSTRFLKMQKNETIIIIILYNIHNHKD